MKFNAFVLIRSLEENMFVPRMRNGSGLVFSHGAVPGFYLRGLSDLECLIGFRIVRAMSLDSTPGDSISFPL